MVNWFRKRESKKIRNCKHPDFAHLVEKAFVGHGVDSKKTQYYRFKGDNELDMIAGRYNKAQKFLIEAVMRINSEDLKFYIGKMKDSMTGTEINLVELGKWLSLIEDRTQLLIESETALKLASATYFDESEVLDGYDYAYNLKKIEAWKKGGDYSFFFKKPMRDLLPLPESWEQDLEVMNNYLSMVDTEIESRTDTLTSMPA